MWNQNLTISRGLFPCAALIFVFLLFWKNSIETFYATWQYMHFSLVLWVTHLWCDPLSDCPSSPACLGWVWSDFIRLCVGLHNDGLLFLSIFKDVRLSVGQTSCPSIGLSAHLSVGRSINLLIEIQSIEASGLKFGGWIGYGLKACRMKFEQKNFDKECENKMPQKGVKLLKKRNWQ